MCLYIDKTKHILGRIPRISIRPIRVCKILHWTIPGRCMTPSMNFPVEFKNGISILSSSSFEYRRYPDIIAIHRGIHSYENKQVCLTQSKKKHDAIIPPFTPYYIGLYGDIVSTKLVIFETEEDYNKYASKHKKIKNNIMETDVKKFYLRIRKHGKKKQIILRKQLDYKHNNDERYSAYQHGLAEGYVSAYINIIQWFKECQK